MGEPRCPSLEIDENARFQRHEWRVQWGAWTLLALIVLAAAVGLLGPGYFSSEHASSGPLEVRYERFLHHGLITTVEFRVQPTGSGEVRLWVDSKWFSAMNVQSWGPEPGAQVSRGDRVEFDFGPAHDSGVAVIRLNAVPIRWGKVPMRAGLVAGAGNVDVWQFVYP